MQTSSQTQPRNILTEILPPAYSPIATNTGLAPRSLLYPPESPSPRFLARRKPIISPSEPLPTSFSAPQISQRALAHSMSPLSPFIAPRPSPTFPLPLNQARASTFPSTTATTPLPAFSASDPLWGQTRSRPRVLAQPFDTRASTPSSPFPSSPPTFNPPKNQTRSRPPTTSIPTRPHCHTSQPS
jgi:hypothetical protein